MTREKITEEIKRKLYAESMGRCMNPNCRAELFLDKGDIIERAHIIPYCETADNSYDNLIILCPNCHTNFDKNGAFSADEVKQWKLIRKQEVIAFFKNDEERLALKNDIDRELQNEYRTVRKKISRALTMYACCLANPVDLAKTSDHRLPQLYAEGSDCLRELASEVKALHETASTEQLQLLFPDINLKDIAGYLIGLSNSFATPYNCPDNSYDQRVRRTWIKKIREGLDLRE